MQKLSGNHGKNARLLWLTDTYGDRNGVSTVLKAIHEEIKSRNLPVDMMICSSTYKPEDHLFVVRPVSEFSFPMYREQPVRIPNYLAIQRIFRRGRYTRIICSTEGPMGLAALMLKNLFSVETSFYIHTDWLEFAREVLSMEQAGLRRLEKALRIYYRRYDSVFVLNTDQQQWLTGACMGFDPARVFLTAHWADPGPSAEVPLSPGTFPFSTDKPVVLFAGRISKEKGVLELPGIFRMIRDIFPEVQMVIAGTGPALTILQQEMPEAYFLGWADREQLLAVYRASDILLLPSRFDTFSCVVLEALGCGLPVVAYNSKGPKDILCDSVNGYLVETEEEMAGRVIGYFLDPLRQIAMKNAAKERAAEYQAERIMDRLLQDVRLTVEPVSP